MQWKHETYDAALRGCRKFIAPKGLDQSVLVAGTGRSGTTALMAAIAAGMHGQPVFEPLRPESDRLVAGIVPDHGYPRVLPGEASPALRALLAQVFAGRRLTHWSAAHGHVRRYRSAHCLVVKEVRANRILGWVEQEFPDVAVVSIFRHPLGVVASMASARQGWKQMRYVDIVPPAAKALGVAPLDLAGPKDDPALWLAALWLADTWCALRELSSQALAKSVMYEDLVTSPDRVVAMLCEEWNDLDVAATTAALKRPSRTASTRLGESLRLTRSRFSASQLRDIGAMLRAFELTMYDLADSEPVLRPDELTHSHNQNEGS